MQQDLAEAMDCLPTSQEQSLRLFYFGRFSIAEIGRRMDRQPGTIKKWLHHGRHGLRRFLESYPLDNMGDAS